VRDFHQRIVDDDGEVVRGGAVGADDDRIADDVVLKAHLAADKIGEDDVGSFGYAKTNGGLLTGGHPPRHLILRKIAARPGILHGTSGGHRRLTLRFELFHRAETVIGGAGTKELFRV